MVNTQRCNPASQSGSSHSKGAPPPHPPHPPNNRTANTETNMPPLPCMGGGGCVCVEGGRGGGAAWAPVTEATPNRPPPSPVRPVSRPLP